MSEDAGVGAAGWFTDISPEDAAGAIRSIRDGESERPDDWPQRAVEAGDVDSQSEYYDWLHEATIATASEAIHEREQAADRQLIHAVRSMDDCRRTANELAERVAEWGGDRLEDTGTGIEYARAVANEEIDGPSAAHLRSLASQCVTLDAEADELRAFIERTAPDVAPNLSAMAGPVLAVRLMDLAGGLESLAKMPSGTVQLLGAEDALFAHLRGDGPSPKHGVIYTHDYVRGIDPANRGSAARAVAGKFTIAARVDHYSGDRRPGLDAELDERIATIRARTEGTSDGDGGDE